MVVGGKLSKGCLVGPEWECVPEGGGSHDSLSCQGILMTFMAKGEEAERMAYTQKCPCLGDEFPSPRPPSGTCGSQLAAASQLTQW